MAAQRPLMSANPYEALQTATEHLRFASGILYTAKFAASHGDEVDPDRMLDALSALEEHMGEVAEALMRLNPFLDPNPSCC